MIKLLMTWNINDREDPAQLEFIMRSFVPALLKYGVISDGWLAMAHESTSPEMIFGMVTEDELELRTFIESEEWQDLRQQLERYTTKFRYWFTDKIQDPGGFQM